MIIEPWYWIVFGVLLLIVEMFTLTFASLWFGAAAIIVGLINYILPLSVIAQIILWLLLSIVCIIIWFKFIKPLAVDKTKAGLGSGAIIGEIGILITVPQQENTGIVRFSVPMSGAAEWPCRTKNSTLSVGDKVKITEIVGNELVVESTL